MHPKVAEFFAEKAEEYRRGGNPRMAEVMEESLSMNLLGDYARVIEAECEQALIEHHRRIRDGEVS